MKLERKKKGLPRVQVANGKHEQSQRKKGGDRETV